MDLKIESWRVKNRENSQLEFKTTFHSRKIKWYLKTIASFANNKWWSIIFGVKDSPREAIWINEKYDDFNDFDNKDLAEILQGFLSVKIDFEFSEIRENVNGNEKIFWVLKVLESTQKPVIFLKNEDREKIREGAIYFRYSGKNNEIKANDLLVLIQREKDKEKNRWMEHIEKIATIWPENIAMIDLERWEITEDKKHKLVLDKKLLSQIKYIHKYKSVEEEWALALRIIWEVEWADTLMPSINLEKDFFTTKEVAQKLEWYMEWPTWRFSSYYVWRIISNLDLKEDNTCFQKKNNTSLYTKKAIEKMLEFKATNNLNSVEELKAFVTTL